MWEESTETAEKDDSAPAKTRQPLLTLTLISDLRTYETALSERPGLVLLRAQSQVVYSVLLDIKIMLSCCVGYSVLWWAERTKTQNSFQTLKEHQRRRKENVLQTCRNSFTFSVLSLIHLLTGQSCCNFLFQPLRALWAEPLAEQLVGRLRQTQLMFPLFTGQMTSKHELKMKPEEEQTCRGRSAAQTQNICHFITIINDDNRQRSLLNEFSTKKKLKMNLHRNPSEASFMFISAMFT